MRQKDLMNLENGERPQPPMPPKLYRAFEQK